MYYSIYSNSIGHINGINAGYVISNFSILPWCLSLNVANADIDVDIVSI